MVLHVFAGPTLSKVPGPFRDGVCLHPPATSGDLTRLLRGADGDQAVNLDRVLILDGLYGLDPALQLAELLLALQAGIKIFGAASYGALRAADLAGHGMVPIGRIADLYCRSDRIGDDEVAVLHDPEPPYRARTVALINIRFGLAATMSCAPDSPAVNALIDQLRIVELQDRTWAKLPSAFCASAARSALARVRDAGRDQKLTDALHAIDVSSHSCGRPVSSKVFEWVPTNWQYRRLRGADVVLNVADVLDVERVGMAVDSAVNAALASTPDDIALLIRGGKTIRVRKDGKLSYLQLAELQKVGLGGALDSEVRELPEATIRILVSLRTRYLASAFVRDLVRRNLLELRASTGTARRPNMTYLQELRDFAARSEFSMGRLLWYLSSAELANVASLRPNDAPT